MPEDREIEELTTITGEVSIESRALIIATARAALFGEQAIRKQYGLPPEGNPAQTAPKAGA